MMEKLPVLFISHGSPGIALESDHPAQLKWREIANCIPRPKSILIMTAHWQTVKPAITSNPRPETIHDFYGFPEMMYDIHYPAKGDPELATLLSTTMNLQNEQFRGLDHGAWVPLLSMYPDAEIPVLQLPVCPEKTYQWHLEFGQQFSTLSEQGVLIIGSGGIAHNIRSLNWREPDAIETWTREFLEDTHQKIMAKDFNALCNPENLTHGQLGIPTPEHYLPFLFTIGVGIDRPVQRLFNGINYGTLGMQCYSFGFDKI